MTQVIDPIPYSLLVHDVDVKEHSTDSWGRETVLNSTAVNYVRLEKVSSFMLNGSTFSKEATDILYVDKTNSTNADVFENVDLENGNTLVVEHRGIQYSIIKVETLYTFDGEIPHHYEVQLKG